MKESSAAVVDRRRGPRGRTFTAVHWSGAGAIGVLILLPYMGSTYSQSLITTILLYGVFAMSLDVLLGYTGLASFGHAAFFGLGAYTAGLIGIHSTNSIWVVVPAAMLVAGTAAVIIGYLAIRSAGVYFLMLTLAVAQLLHAFSVSRLGEIAGGANGLPGIPRPSLAPLPDLVDFGQRVPFYYLTLAFFVISFLFLRWVVTSPFGRSLVGIRESEARMRALGYTTSWYKLAAFVIAGAVAGAAGAMFAFQRGFTSPELLYWTTSGLALIMVIIGGAGTLVGPVLGAGLYVIVQDYISSYTERWQLLFGIVFVLSVYLMRDGIAGLAQRVGRRYASSDVTR